MTAIALDRAGLERFVALIRAAPRARLRREELWQAFATAFPARPQGVDERRWFRAALDAVAATGVVQLPSPGRSTNWDRGQEPALPQVVTVVRPAAPARDDDWRRFAWHPALAWVADQRTLAADQVAFLHRVHEGLRVGRFTEPAPLKYRSLELTGDEKRLQALAKSTLFGPGRLSLELLGCLPDWLPLAVERVGPAPAALVVENAGPFDVAVRVLRDMAAAPYGLVVYGDGGRVERSLPRLLTLAPDLQEIGYVGDLDWHGLRIALGAGRLAAAVGLPPVVPAPGVHEAMMSAAAGLGMSEGWVADPETDGGAGSPANADTLLRWVPAHARERIRKLLIRGRRIPEEVLGPAELRRIWGS